MNQSKEQAGETCQPILKILPREEGSFAVPATVMDDLTYKLVQMPDLLRVMDTSLTHSGSLVLERSLRQPPTTLDLTRAKQEAVREISSDDKLRLQLERYLEEAVLPEKDFYTYFHGKYRNLPYGWHPNLYDAFKGTRRFLQHSTEGVEGIEARSEYLNSRLQTLRSFADTEIYDWVKNPIYKTPFGLRNKGTAPWYLPKMRFYATDLKPHYYLGFAGLVAIMAFPVGLMTPFLFPSTVHGSPISEALHMTYSMSLLGFSMSPVIWATGLSREMDKDWFIKPMAENYFNSEAVTAVVDNLGMIDELMTLVKYRERIKGPAVLPEVNDHSPHQFSARGLRNPLMAVENSDYVPNDVDLNGARVTFITGPNSGGKTSFCKTLAQAQILAQIGSYIPAEAAQIAMADRVFYHAPMINSLTDEEGRFGVEVARTRDLFLQTTPRSLVMLDELIEATTYEERLSHSYDILDAFWHIASNTVLVTHNHQLAERFKDEGRGQHLQVEFKGKKPTHRLIPGISSESHSDQVMEKLGFTRDDMLKHLKNSGYIQ